MSRRAIVVQGPRFHYGAFIESEKPAPISSGTGTAFHFFLKNISPITHRTDIRYLLSHWMGRPRWICHYELTIVLNHRGLEASGYMHCSFRFLKTSVSFFPIFENNPKRTYNTLPEKEVRVNPTGSGMRDEEHAGVYNGSIWTNTDDSKRISRTGKHKG